MFPIYGIIFLIILINIISPIQTQDQTCFSAVQNISVTNLDNEFKISPELLLKINSYDLIRSNRMQPDCSDFLLYSADILTGGWIYYWVESGCGSTELNVWIRPSLYLAPNQTIIITLYSGFSCDGEMTDMNLDYPGYFYIPVLGDGCEDLDGYVENAAKIDSGYYVMANEGTSTILVEKGKNSHFHNYDGTTASANSGSSGNRDGETIAFSSRYHTHTFSGVSSTEEVFPEYYTLNYCPLKRIYLGNGGIHMFSSGSLPDGVTRNADMDNKFIFTGNVTGITGGSNTHTHDATGLTDAGINSQCAYIPGSTSVVLYSDLPLISHSHEYDGSFSTHTLIPEFFTMIFGKVTDESFLVSENLIVAARSKPPLGWTYFSEPEEYLIRGGSTYGSIGGDSDFVHSHSFSLSFDPCVVTSRGSLGTDNAADSDHSHSSYSGTSDDSSNFDVPTLSLSFYQRNVITWPNITYGDFEFFDFLCYGTSVDDPSVCGTYGNCTGANQCDCVSYKTGDLCEYELCNGVSSEDETSICSGHGHCYLGECYCDYASLSYYIGNDCQYWKCSGIWNNDSSVCNGRGDCVSRGVCKNCDEGYTGSNCQFYICYDIDGNEEGVCSGHGQCVGIDECDCNTSYSGDECEIWSCGGIQNDNERVCNYVGECIDTNNCTCNSSVYFGALCDEWECDGINKYSEYVCNKAGICTAPDVCNCKKDQYQGEFCQYPICYGLSSTDSQVCSGHGSCRDYNDCNCIDANYGGDQCDEALAMCNGILSNESTVCATHGDCIDDVCICKDGWTGDNCETQEVDGISSVLIVVLSLVSVCGVVIFIVVIVVVCVNFIFLVLYMKKVKENKESELSENSNLQIEQNNETKKDKDEKDEKKKDEKETQKTNESKKKKTPKEKESKENKK